MPLNRPQEITLQFCEILNKHLDKIVSGEEEHYLEIHQIADLMHLHPTPLSNTIKQTTGKSPCDICNEQTIAKAKELMQDTEFSIADVARQLTFDPSNFTKYFKRHSGITPGAYRKSLFA